MHQCLSLSGGVFYVSLFPMITGLAQPDSHIPESQGREQHLKSGGGATEEEKVLMRKGSIVDSLTHGP